jgi:hypothetical protein
MGEVGCCDGDADEGKLEAESLKAWNRSPALQMASLGSLRPTAH